ncbi:MAG: MlaC/ttg2D family ABC transporter substrate-binding protein [Methylophagaceae bacterium]
MMLKGFFKGQWLILLTILPFFLMPSIVLAEVPVPQTLIKTTSDRMQKALKENKATIEKNPSFVYGLVDKILLPNFDFSKMSKLALGKNWRKASTAQRERFIGEFRLLLVRTYSIAMLEFTDGDIVFLPFRGDLAKKKVKVKMEIARPNGPTIPMALSMYLNKQKKWMVYDVKIEGISLVTNYRSTFATEIRNDGMDKLIENLSTRNQKVKL